MTPDFYNYSAKSDAARVPVMTPRFAIAMPAPLVVRASGAIFPRGDTSTPKE